MRGHWWIGKQTTQKPPSSLSLPEGLLRGPQDSKRLLLIYGIPPTITTTTTIITTTITSVAFIMVLIYFPLVPITRRSHYNRNLK